jgi:antitoxin ParD1/3/4
MASININLTDELKQFVDGQVEAGEFGGVVQYIEALIERAKTGKEKLEELLVEGLNSGDPIPLDDDQWSQIRKEVNQRIANGQQ